MSAALDRANEIVELLLLQEVRATTDPSAANPPCIVVPPPSRTFDLGCGYSARWELAALAPSPTSTDRTAWAALDLMIDAARNADLPVETAQLVTFNLGGTDYPAYLLAWTEAI